MKFDCVIGNPPYNNQLYYKFIDLVTRVAPCYNSYVIPSAWVSKAQFEDFKEHIKVMKYYLMSLEVFKNIEVHSGITYYLYSRDERYNEAYIVNQLEKFQIYNEALRPIGDTGNNVIYQLGVILKNHRHLELPEYTQRYNLITTHFMSGNLVRDRMMVPPLRLIKLADNETLKQFTTSDVLIYSSNNIDEIYSFASWYHNFINCYLFVLNCAVDSYTLNSDVFLNLPIPEEFDHVYTQDEIYKYFNIPADIQEHLNKLCKTRGKQFYDVILKEVV